MPGRDATGRGQTQAGAGEFPLSEPETRATVMFLLTHPNVSVANSMDTRVPLHLRPPSTSNSADRMYPEDLAYYQRFDSIGMSLTGYPWAGDVYNTYQTRTAVDPFTGDSARPGPLFGHGPDFGYFYYGAIWYGNELWNGGRMRDVNGDSLLDDVDGLAWDDAETGGRGFREWEPFTHPMLGAVEIGGFHPKFFAQNGPAHQLERWARNQALLNLQLALHLPRLDSGQAMPRRLNMSQYSITSVNVSCIVNGMALSDVDVCGDTDIGSWEVYDSVTFYTRVIDPSWQNSYDLASYKTTTDLGAGTAAAALTIHIMAKLVPR